MPLYSKYYILNNNHRASRGGQVMIEAMVALSALTLGYLAIITLLNQSLSLSTTVSDRNIATYLSAEGIEIVRNISDAAIRSGTFAKDFMNGGRQFIVSWEDVLEPNSADPDNFNPGRLAVNQNDDMLKFSSQKGYNYSEGEPTRFYRSVQVEVEPNVANATYIKVRSVVSWVGKGGLTDSITTEDFFFNWR